MSEQEFDSIDDGLKTVAEDVLKKLIEEAPALKEGYLNALKVILPSLALLINLHVEREQQRAEQITAHDLLLEAMEIELAELEEPGLHLVEGSKEPQVNLGKKAEILVKYGQLLGQVRVPLEIR